jgi:hypothetical protein
MTGETPVRVQRCRTAGWRAPENSRYVGRARGSVWGNPWSVQPAGRTHWTVHWDGPRGVHPPNGAYNVTCAYQSTAHEQAVKFYREWLRIRPDLVEKARVELAGLDLMCWCKPELPCHADVLLAVARGEQP